jgi:hypothetical protein
MRFLMTSFVLCIYLARTTIISYINMSHNTQLPPFQKYVRALPTGERNSALITVVRIKLITARLRSIVSYVSGGSNCVYGLTAALNKISTSYKAAP